ncbi:helix-turn-helix domain-containing protein [Eubacterium ventriosum]
MCLMSKRIKECRLNSHLTQEELADMLGLKKSAIAKYENGRVENIKRSTIEKMSTIFDVKPSYIMGWADVPNGYRFGSELKKAISEVSEETDVPCLEIIQLLFNPNLDISDTNKVLNKDNIKKIVQKYYPSSNLQNNLSRIYFDCNEYTKDELAEICQFAEFIKKRRK